MAIQSLSSELHTIITGMTFHPYYEVQLDPNIHINVLADDLCLFHNENWCCRSVRYKL
jgi:hypothetical protein